MKKMPRYTYRCKACQETLEQVHSMTVVLEDCHLCGVHGSLVRVPSTIIITNYENNSNTSTKPGKLVEQHIEEAREEVRLEKESMSQEYEL